MAKFNDTVINGDLYINGNTIKSNGEDVLLDKNVKGDTNVYYYIPFILWVGKINIQSSPSIIEYNKINGFNITSTVYNSTGVVTVNFGGENAPTMYQNYQVITIGTGRDTNNTTLPSHVTIYDKSIGSFTLKLADDNSTNNGYCEIMIITFRQLDKHYIYE